MAERYRNVTTVSNPDQIRFDTADPRYKLARKVDIRTGSYGSTSPFGDPRRLAGDSNNRFKGTDPGFGRGSWNWTGDGVEEASRRSTNKAVTVEARTVEGSTRQTLGNRARVSVANATDRFGKGVSSAKSAFGKGTAGAAGNTAQSAASSSAQSAAKSSASSAVGKGVGAVARSVSSSASGGVSVGAYRGGLGVGISRGGLDLGVGFASVSYNFSNPNESAIGGAFNTLTIKGTQEGCTITLDYQFMGKSYFKETRQADQCTTPEPQPKSHPRGEGEGETELPPTPLPQPSPGTVETVETTDPVVTIYNFGQATNIFVSYSSRSFAGRDNYEYDTRTETYTAYDTDLSVDSYNLIATVNAIQITEWEERGTIFFSDGKAIPDLAGSYQYHNKYYDLRFPGSDFGLYYGIVSNWRLNWATYNPQITPFRLGSFSDRSPYTTSIPFFYTNRLGNTVNLPGNSIPFLYQRGRANQKFNFTPADENSILPKRSIITPRGLKEPMEDRQQILLERVYQMLGGDTFWENGLAIPNELFTPEGEGYTRTKSYNGIAHLMFDTLDHRTPGQVEYTLPNGVDYKSINAQGYFQDLGANVAETLEETKKKESNNSQVMNYLTRNAFLSNQIFKIVLKTNRIVKALLSFLNVPVDQEVEEVDVPFDMSLGGKLGKKGFGSPKELDDELEKLIQEQLKTDPKGEKIAAKFGNNGKAKITLAKIKESAEGGDFWWFIKQNLR